MSANSDEIGGAPTAVRRRASWWRRLALILAVVAALPFMATVVYRWMPPPVSALMLIRAVQGGGMDYRWTPIDQMSPHLVKAVVTAEDARICEHNGVDWEVLGELIEASNGPTRGGSTIAMQTAKNLFLWPARSYVRKGLELPLATWIDFTWPKRRIVEVYLNIAEWGPGIYGAEAAARHHFGKSAAKLSLNEAARLAAALPNPRERSAAKPGRSVRRQAARITRRVPSTSGHLGCLGL